MPKKISKTTGLNLDLGQFNKTSHGFLKEEENKKIVNEPIREQSKKIPKAIENKPVEKEGDKKLGRPMIEGELLNKKLIASVTETEYNKILKDAGLVSASTYLRTKMREARII